MPKSLLLISVARKNGVLRVVLRLGSVLGAVALAACGDPGRQVEVELPKAVKVLEVRDGGLGKLVEFPGQIDAVQRTWKAFEVDGRIIENPVKEGKAFRKGDVLARVDPRDFRSARDSAAARYQAAVIGEGRLRGLYERKAVAKQQFELATRDLATAKADLERAEKALEDTELVADFDGTVAKVLVDEFANVDAKQNVMLIIDTSSMEIAIHVPEGTMAIPMPGGTPEEKVARARAVVIPSAMPELEFPARFAEASDAADPVTRTYEVTLAFNPAPELDVRPGMTAKVRAWVPANARSRSEGYPVPAAAVFSDDEGRPHVWKVDPGKLTVRAARVEMGAMIGDSVVVTGELGSGDLVATSGVHQLRSGQEIRVWGKP